MQFVPWYLPSIWFNCISFTILCLCMFSVSIPRLVSCTFVHCLQIIQHNSPTILQLLESTSNINIIFKARLLKQANKKGKRKHHFFHIPWVVFFISAWYNLPSFFFFFGRIALSLHAGEDIFAPFYGVSHLSLVFNSYSFAFIYPRTFLTY